MVGLESHGARGKDELRGPESMLSPRPCRITMILAHLSLLRHNTPPLGRSALLLGPPNHHRSLGNRCSDLECMVLSTYSTRGCDFWSVLTVMNPSMRALPQRPRWRSPWACTLSQQVCAAVPTTSAGLHAHKNGMKASVDSPPEPLVKAAGPGALPSFLSADHRLADHGSC
eukprot:1134327-Pelagomonas_calceolata.AAC.1